LFVFDEVNNYTVQTNCFNLIQIVNPHLLKDLTERGLWDAQMKNKLIANNGSVQSITEIPAEIRALYKTVWELSQKTVIDMAADRGAFIDQSQSLNIHIAEPSFAKLTSMHFYAWKKVADTSSFSCFLNAYCILF